MTPRDGLIDGVRTIWCDVLGVDAVALDDDFLELGGTSLGAIQMATRVRDEFGIDLPITSALETTRFSAWIERVCALAPSVGRGQESGGGSRPLSFFQERLRFITQLQASAVSAYISARATEWFGPLDSVALDSALHQLVARHDVLRSLFPESADAVQVLPPTPNESVLLVEDFAVSGSLAAAVARRAKLLADEIDSERGPSYRWMLLRLAPDRHIFLRVEHHLVRDIESDALLDAEIAKLYAAARSGRPPGLGPAPQYAGFASAQRAAADGPAFEVDLAYWRDRLSDLPGELILPLDRPRAPLPTYRGASIGFALSSPAATRLRQLSREAHTTPFITLLTVFGGVLARYAGADTVVVGSPGSGRRSPQDRQTAGPFVTTLVLPLDFAGEPSFRTALARTRASVLGALEHERVPFEKLVELVQTRGEPSRAPLVQALLSYEDEPRRPLELPGLSARALELPQETSKFDLAIYFHGSDAEIEARVEYNTDLFTAATIDRFIGHFQGVLAAALEDPDLSVTQLPLLSEAERHLQLISWNRTERNYRLAGGLQGLFEACAAAKPSAVAIDHAAGAFTYGQLDANANQLARYLHARGVKRGDRVGIYLNRDPRIIIAMLAVLKAGAAYVPTDPTYPPARTTLTLDDARVTAVITSGDLAAPRVTGAAVIDLDRESVAIRQQEEARVAIDSDPRDLAYVIYTSGSTGRPKGVAIEHRSALVFCHWARETYTDDELRRVLAGTSICFDLSVFEIFVTLAWGGTVVLAENALDLGAARDVSLVNTVPSVFGELLRLAPIPNSVRTVNLAGEPLPAALVGALRQSRPDIRLLNLYGPTEDTTYSTFAEIGDLGGTRPTIGRPIAGTQTFILDRRLQPVPIGVIGELYLGGAGLARGYLHNDDLTRERFVSNPLGVGPPRLYRTGDAARYLDDGAIDYVGRLDQQVKLRGFRVELGEIEHVLALHPEVHEAVAVVREDEPDTKRLVAYVAGPTRLGGRELRTFCADHLPEYMVPAAIVVLPTLPRTPNGKIDRRVLPRPHAETRDPEAGVPSTRTEHVIRDAFAELLGTRDFVATDGFFQLGGHSLLATRLVGRLRRDLGVDVPLSAIFRAPSVRALGAWVDQNAHVASSISESTILTASDETVHPVSLAQEQMLRSLSALGPTTLYQLPRAFRLHGPVDDMALGRAIAEVVRRHAVLRTRFPHTTGKRIQEVMPWRPDLLEIREAPPRLDDAQARTLALTTLTPAFDVTGEALFRAVLFRSSDRDALLVFSTHHLVFDGWSLGILLREVSALYEGWGPGGDTTLPPLRVQYGDYASWQRERLERGVRERELAFWRPRLIDMPVDLPLPTDRDRPARASMRRSVEPLTISMDAQRNISGLVRSAGTTLFAALLAAFKLHLWARSGSEDLAVLTSVAGRVVPELDDLIGYFSNNVVLRTKISDASTFGDLLSLVSAGAVDAQSHQEVHYESLMEVLRPELLKERLAPVPAIRFALDNVPVEPLKLAGVEVVALELSAGGTRRDLGVHLDETSRGLVGRIEYNLDIFDRESIRALGADYCALLAGVALESKLEWARGVTSLALPQ